MARRATASFIEPMLLLRQDALPDDPTRWLYQLKLDGYRAVAFKTGKLLHLRSRNNKDFSRTYPAVFKALATLPNETVIDGEIVAVVVQADPQRTKTRRPTRPPKRQTALDTAAHVAKTQGLAYLQERLYAVLQPVITAALETAIGLRHLYEQDPTTGQWSRVTDPDVIVARLNEPHGAAAHRLVLYEQDPDARLLEGLLTFVLEAPFDPARYPSLVEAIEVDADTGELTVRVSEAFLADVRRLQSGHRQAHASPTTERLASRVDAATRQVH